MKWTEYYNKTIPSGAERVIKKFAWFPISFPIKGGLEWRWLETVYIRQRWNESLFGDSRWYDTDFATKVSYLNTKIYD